MAVRLLSKVIVSAAIRAGYSAKSAEQQGPRLLGNAGVSAAIQAAQAKRADRTEITADRVLKVMARLAFFDPRKLWRAGCGLMLQQAPVLLLGLLSRRRERAHHDFADPGG